MPDPARLPAPLKSLPSSLKMDDKSRIGKFMKDHHIQVKPEMAECFNACKPALTAVIKGVRYVWPYYMKAYVKGYEIYKVLPHSIITMIFGAALCFFGGTYVGALAAFATDNACSPPLCLKEL